MWSRFLVPGFLLERLSLPLIPGFLRDEPAMFQRIELTYPCRWVRSHRPAWSSWRLLRYLFAQGWLATAALAFFIVGLIS